VVRHGEDEELLDGCTIVRLESLEQVRDDWDRLAEGAGHVFATWEWISSRWEQLAGERELYSFAVRDSQDRVRVILPFYVGVSRPVRIARFIGYGDLNSPLCAHDYRPLAAAAIRRVLGRGGGACQALLGESMPAAEGWRGLLGARVLDEHPDPLLHINGSGWEDFLAARSRRFRKRTRQQERRLERDFELVYRLADDPARIDADIDDLFRLHSMRWGGDTTGVFEGERGEQQRVAIKGALERGWLRLWFLELDGRTAAADLAWRWRGSEWAMNCGRDPEFDKQSVGAVLMSHAVREACEDRVCTYRLLQGDAAYKLDFADDVWTSETLLVGSGVLGRLASVAAAAVDSLPEHVRGRVMRALR